MLFIQTKVFVADELFTLESLVNEFLAAMSEPLDLLDVQYNLAKTAKEGENPRFSAAIVFWKES